MPSIEEARGRKQKRAGADARYPTRVCRRLVDQRQQLRRRFRFVGPETAGDDQRVEHRRFDAIFGQQHDPR